MYVGKRIWLDGRIVFGVAVCGLCLQLFNQSIAKPRGIRDELLIHDAVWAVGMALMCGWAMACLRRGPVDGRGAAGGALLVGLVGVVCVAVELARHILHPSPL